MGHYLKCSNIKICFALTQFLQIKFIFYSNDAAKGQTNSKLFFQANISSKKGTNKFDFTTCRLVFVGFLEESEDTKIF